MRVHFYTAARDFYPPWTQLSRSKQGEGEEKIARGIKSEKHKGKTPKPAHSPRVVMTERRFLAPLLSAPSSPSPASIAHRSRSAAVPNSSVVRVLVSLVGALLPPLPCTLLDAAGPAALLPEASVLPAPAPAAPPPRALDAARDAGMRRPACMHASRSAAPVENRTGPVR
jgi:hypothetical protein